MVRVRNVRVRDALREVCGHLVWLLYCCVGTSAIQICFKMKVYLQNNLFVGRSAGLSMRERPPWKNSFQVESRDWVSFLSFASVKP